MRAFTWTAVSASKLSDVDPADNTNINPLVGDSPWRGSDGQRAVIAAWGSAVWDDVNRKLWIPIGGGHGNYAGNECYVHSLGSASPRWSMPRAPSGAIGNRLSVDDGREATSTYADGRPRSIHPYNNVCYAPGVGPVITRISAPYSNSNASSNRAFCLDPSSGESRLVFDFGDPSQTGFPSGTPYGQGTGGAANAACCHDPVRNRIVTVGIGNRVNVLWCTPSTLPGPWRGGHLPAVIGPSGGAAQALVYLPEQDRYLHLVPWQGNVYHKLIHPDTGAMTDLGPVFGSLAPGLHLDSMTGAAWAPELGRVLLWNQVSNAAQISTLAYPGNLISAWPAGTVAVSGVNTVTPPTQPGNGTFGLFGYSSSLRGCYLITGTNAPVHFFATQ